MRLSWLNGNIRANYESHIKAKPSEGERKAFLKGVADKAGSFNDPSKVRKEIEEAQNKAERDISQNMHQVKGHFHTKMDKKDAEFKDKDGKWQTKRAFLNAWKVRRE